MTREQLYKQAYEQATWLAWFTGVMGVGTLAGAVLLFLSGMPVFGVIWSGFAVVSLYLCKVNYNVLRKINRAYPVSSQ